MLRHTCRITSESEKIHFNQLHAECHSRIQYKKTCPIHGEVRNDEIVSGFQYSKGQYVVVDPAELDKLRTEDDKAITINTFIPPEAIDPLYYSGKTYYLIPDGPVGQKPYGVILQAMLEEKQYAIAQVVMHGASRRCCCDRWTTCSPCSCSTRRTVFRPPGISILQLTRTSTRRR